MDVHIGQAGYETEETKQQLRLSLQPEGKMLFEMMEDVAVR